jgi:hypothetical protein
VEVIFLVRGRAYALPADDARWLADTIRRACVDEAGRPLSTDESIRACIQLADIVSENLQRGSSPQTIELGWRPAEGLLTFVLREDVVDRSPQLAALYEALLRLREDRR